MKPFRLKIHLLNSLTITLSCQGKTANVCDVKLMFWLVFVVLAFDPVRFDKKRLFNLLKTRFTSIKRNVGFRIPIELIQIT